MIKKEKIDEEQLKTNPLTAHDFKVIIRKLVSKGSYTKDGEHWLPSGHFVEQQPATRLYHQVENRLLVSLLSPGAKSLFLWIMYELDVSKDYLWINKERYMKENNITSINTYKEARNQLITSLVITPTIYTDTYWINPKIFFCGSRVTKYPDHLEVYKPIKKEEE